MAHHIIINGGTKDNLLCDVCRNGSCTEFMSGDIVCSVRIKPEALKLQGELIDPDMVVAYLLQSGGAIEIKITEYKD